MTVILPQILLDEEMAFLIIYRQKSDRNIYFEIHIKNPTNFQKLCPNNLPSILKKLTSDIAKSFKHQDVHYNSRKL